MDIVLTAKASYQMQYSIAVDRLKGAPISSKTNPVGVASYWLWVWVYVLVEFIIIIQ